MGIRGLTTFINNQCSDCLEDFQLHDTQLVLDGNSISCQLYSRQTKSNCAFGGDYDKYAQSVVDFYNRLLKCNVTPIVLFDGGLENKKMKTIVLRRKQKTRSALSYLPGHSDKFLPLFTTDVFKSITKQKGIRQATCLFEADGAIASVAKILNCPVLSFDSDFYIFGTLYIPFDTLHPYVVKKPDGTGYMNVCKIYKAENLLTLFRGLSQPMLPLAAILLGNDYVKKGTFKYFFRHMKLQQHTRKKVKREQIRIKTTFKWLSRHNLNDAVTMILSRVPKSFRSKLLNIIEENVNGYYMISSEILGPLGFNEKEISQFNNQCSKQVFKYQGNIYDLPNIEQVVQTNSQNSSETEEDSEEEEDLDNTLVDVIQECENISNEKLPHNIPQWFLNEFVCGNFSTYFIDLIVRNLYICPIQLEERFRPASIEGSLKIISVIYTILVSNMNTRKRNLKYVARCPTGGIRYYQLYPNATMMCCINASLYDLNELPSNIRKKILFDTLGLTDMLCLDDLPDNWRLYIATLKYWIDQAKEKYSKLHCYLYSLLFCVLIPLVDNKIGKQRVLQSFHTKQDNRIAQIQSARKAAETKPSYSTDAPIMQMIEELNNDDCLLAAPFFISHFEFNQKLHSNVKLYDKTVVHAYSEFQNCMRHSMDLNALLKYPLPQIDIGKIFNGTFVYNMCVNFKTRRNANLYITNALHASTTVVRLFKALTSKMKDLIPNVLENEENTTKSYHRKSKRQRRSSHQSTSQHEIESSNNDDTSEHESESFHDPNNRFMQLFAQQN